MKIILSIALATIVVSLPVHSSVISAKNGSLNCDGLICPEGSTSCIVSQKTFGDLTQYKYVRICTDEFGGPTDSKTEELDNPSPGTVINTISLYGGNRELTEAERKEIRDQIDKMVAETDQIVKDAADYVKETTNYWNNWTSDFTANMKKKFPPGFPFIK
ncbi:uncharacterized protein LOC119080102 [Bradysia coprophila]|uniref:uncharacterized protein LOC119080102 n=1 Tax=Bradysia coprophila TaxID=38358 RepID=UPI00187DB708|nr:uncharacterized protein LOC119080102 [Bradysia coprophila]